jgi:hypothetical protein
MSSQRSVVLLILAGALSVTIAPACGGRSTAVSPSAQTPTSAEVAAAPAAAPVATDGVLPVGSALRVRTVDVISSEGAKEGTPFEATLASAIRDAKGAELVPSGTKVQGRVVEAEGGGAIKRPRLAVTINAIEAPERVIPIAANSAGAEGARGGAVKKVGAGTLIGAAAGNVGAGAAIGGAAVLLSGKNHIVIPAGTLVEFNLTQPAHLR